MQSALPLWLPISENCYSAFTDPKMSHINDYIT